MSSFSPLPLPLLPPLLLLLLLLSPSLSLPFDHLAVVVVVGGEGGGALSLEKSLSSLDVAVEMLASKVETEVFVTVEGEKDWQVSDIVQDLSVRWDERESEGDSRSGPISWEFHDYPLIPASGSSSSRNSLSSALTRILSHTSAKWVLVLDANVILSPSSLVELRELSQSSDFGLVGGLLHSIDHSLYSRGMNFVLGPKGGPWAHMNDVTDEVIYLHPTQRGRVVPPIEDMGLIASPDKALFAFSRDLYDELDGFTDEFSHSSYFLADYAMRIRNSTRSRKVALSPALSGTFLSSDSMRGAGVWKDFVLKSDFVRENAVAFTEKWLPFLPASLSLIDAPPTTTATTNSIGSASPSPAVSDRSVSNMTLVYHMECGTGQVFGFTMEAVHFVLSLHQNVRVVVKVNQPSECEDQLVKAGLSVDALLTMTRLMNRDTPTPSDTHSLVRIIHRDPGRYRYSYENFGNLEPQLFSIGRSMFETDSIPSDWLPEIANWKMDEIWVPSQFNVDTFTTAGVDPAKLVVIPELTDVTHFDSSLHLPLSLPFVSGGDTGSSHSGSKGSGGDGDGEHEGTFVFLSILKWEERKAWDVMLSSYFNEFGPQSSSPSPSPSSPPTPPVALVLLCRQNEESKKEYRDFLEEYAAAVETTVELLPPVYFLNLMLPYTKLPSLYKSADAFVLATHGEGWGLPLMEAMSMEVPVIGTNWGGSSAFLTDENSFSVENSGPIPAPIENHHWASPDAEQLQRQMRRIVSDRTLAKTKAKQAREDVVEKFSYEAVSSLVLDRLRLIKKALPEVQRLKQASHASNNNSGWFNSDSSSTTNTGNFGGNGGGGSAYGSPRSIGEFQAEDGTVHWRIKILEQAPEG
eukprot:TRINITY_DN2422_c0_g1_i1.p1 TRINITY_DN2422_c0_g1~~TRINITY_DN2422_c0_g1_i1.p1  ORF type:complete len:874 (+),score=194.08 TRINITY_DN2422_c0_g1_i1:43-2622(+)